MNYVPIIMLLQYLFHKPVMTNRPADHFASIPIHGISAATTSKTDALTVEVTFSDMRAAIAFAPAINHFVKQLQEREAELAPLLAERQALLESFGYAILEDGDQPGLWIWTNGSDDCDSSLNSKEDAIEDAWSSAIGQTMGANNLSSEAWDAMSYTQQLEVMKETLGSETQTDAKKYFKTIVQIEVLSEDAPYSGSIQNLAYAITEGYISSRQLDPIVTQLTPDKTREALTAQGTDPAFYLGLAEEDEAEDGAPRESQQ